MTGFEAGFRVSHIAAFGLATCCPSEEVISVLSKPALKDFDQIPVRDGKHIIGVLERGRGAPCGSVRDRMRPLDDSILVSSEEPLNRFLAALRGAPYRLVVGGSEINGIVTRSDVGKLPVRLVAFTLVTHLEVVMADAVREKYGDSPDWLQLLRPDQRKTVEDRGEKRRRENLHIPLLELTGLGHKITTVGKLYGLTGWESRREEVIGLRNSLDHASDFIEECRGVNGFLDRLELVDAWIEEVGIRRSGPGNG